MPRKAIDYSKTHFYKLVCKDTSITDCYVGHTTEFTKRKYYHKCICNNNNNKEFNRYVYKFIRDNGNWENWEMILIKTECCENGLEARHRERFYKEQFNSSLNKQVPSRTYQEMNETNREARQEQRNSINKQKVECECGSIHRRGDMIRHSKTQKHQDYLKALDD